VMICIVRQWQVLISIIGINTHARADF
jgi:hypothetical protein